MDHSQKPQGSKVQDPKTCLMKKNRLEEPKLHLTKKKKKHVACSGYLLGQFETLKILKF